MTERHFTVTFHRKGTIVPLSLPNAVFFRSRIKLLITAAVLFAVSATAQTPSQRLFTLTAARFAADDSLRQIAAFSYDLHLASTFYMKEDSAQVREEWRIMQTSDSIRVQLVARQTTGKAEVAKQYVSPVKLASAQRHGGQTTTADPLLAPVRDILFRIKKDAKSQVMIDGQTPGRNGASNYILRFLAHDRTGALWVNTKTAQLERVEWAYGKSLGVSSSAEKSSVEFAPILNEINFPVRLVVNARNRALLRRTGSYTEIETKNFKREEMP